MGDEQKDPLAQVVGTILDARNWARSAMIERDTMKALLWEASEAIADDGLATEERVRLHSRLVREATKYGWPDRNQ